MYCQCVQSEYKANDFSGVDPGQSFYCSILREGTKVLRFLQLSFYCPSPLPILGKARVKIDSRQTELPIAE